MQIFDVSIHHNPQYKTYQPVIDDIRAIKQYSINAFKRAFLYCKQTLYLPPIQYKFLQFFLIKITIYKHYYIEMIKFSVKKAIKHSYDWLMPSKLILVVAPTISFNRVKLQHLPLSIIKIVLYEVSDKFFKLKDNRLTIF